MNQIGQTASRVAAALRQRRTLRIAAPAGAAVVVVGVLLGVFLTGGAEPDGPTGQSVDITERTAEASGDGTSPADEAADGQRTGRRTRLQPLRLRRRPPIPPVRPVAAPIWLRRTMQRLRAPRRHAIRPAGTGMAPG